MYDCDGGGGRGDLFYGAQLAGRTIAGPVSLALKLFKEFLLKNRLLSAAFAHAIQDLTDLAG